MRAGWFGRSDDVLLVLAEMGHRVDDRVPVRGADGPDRQLRAPTCAARRPAPATAKLKIWAALVADDQTEIKFLRQPSQLADMVRRTSSTSQLTRRLNGS